MCKDSQSSPKMIHIIIRHDGDHERFVFAQTDDPRNSRVCRALQ